MTSSIFKLFGTDKVAEKTGVWINYGDVRFLCARAGGTNIHFSEAYKAKVRPYRHQIDRGTLSKEDDDKIMAELYAETVIKRVEVLVGDSVSAEGAPVIWEPGVPTADGKVLPFSRESVKALLLDLPDMFRDLRECATDANKYLKQAEADDVKNS